MALQHVDIACPICLGPFGIHEEVAIVDDHDKHVCHTTCIKEWLHSNSICPLDRQPVHVLTVKDSLDGDVVEQIPYLHEDGEEVLEEVLEEEEEARRIWWNNLHCLICGGCDDDDQMLLCDCCDQGFHCYCLSVALVEPPEGDWFCEHCDAILRQ